MTNVLICSYLEPEFVARIQQVDSSLKVHYHPELLPAPRYPADHVGSPLERRPDEQARWEGLLGQADVLFDFDYTDVALLPERAKRARWLQATSAGIGQLVARHHLDRTGIIFTTASGVHARPLAEFTLMVMLEHVKRASLARRQQQQRVWQRFATAELSNKTLAVVGYGRIGQEVARLARAFDMRVIASKRDTAGSTATQLGLDELYGTNDLHQMLAQADFVCLVTPHTPETEGLMDGPAFAALKPGAMIVNIGRGVLIEEGALLDALENGTLAHAALDVTATEPLPQDSPLWDHSKVTIYPHSASTGEYENDRITDLFCDNLHRYLGGEALLNRLDPKRMY